MKRRYLYGALALVILVNALVLTGVAYNRSGVPDALVTLTERELPLASTFYRRENSGVSLWLNVNPDIEERTWFDEKKLAELGFFVERMEDSDNRDVYRVLPKKALVVLEYNGEAWQRFRQRQLDEIAALPLKQQQGKLTPETAARQKQEKLFQLTVASRLFAVDAGLDAGDLRRRYADKGRYIIVPAQVRMQVDWRAAKGGKDKKRLRGRIQKILVDQIHVPLPFHASLESLPGKTYIHPGYTYYNSKAPAKVRYQVVVAFGQRLEPWIKAVEKIDEDAKETL
jgi:hypothetical protein